jgi:hypothetical protein
MITIEEARQFYTADKCPSDDELRKLIAFFSWAAISEYNLLIEERAVKQNEQTN